MTKSDAAVKAAGRPRDPSLDEAIRIAAREVVVEMGYEDTTLGVIAQRAGVSIPTIYRRWPSKHELIEEAVLHLDTWRRRASSTTPAGTPADSRGIHAGVSRTAVMARFTA